MHDNKLRYYAAGEYGSKNNRPHYHAIIFNVPDSEMFYNAWHLNGEPIGSIHVGNVSTDSVAYTMKYIDKPSRIPFHARDDRAKEFSLMSKGLGFSYLERPGIQNYHTSDLSRLYITKLDGHKIAMPRYYRNKLYSEAEMKLQTALIAHIVEQAEMEERRHFSHQLLTYEEVKDSERFGRYQRFYANQKNRDL